MARQRSTVFTTIRTEGGLLPADLLARVAAQDRDIPGVRPADYHLVQGEVLGERITRSWNRLTGAWKSFATALAVLPRDDAGTTLTRERWLMPLFEELGYGRLQTSKSEEADGRSYPISHAWGHTPIHLVSARASLDGRTANARGATGSSPHSLVQEFLNRSSRHLWAFVSNGMALRVLRDNASLTRQAFVEFDLETMFADGVFDDFVVLWLTCHQSRVESTLPSECWLEQWTATAAAAGTRARDELRSGVESAIEALGAGFVAHPANAALKARLRSGALSTFEYYRQLLRLIYRLLFLFVAEDRNLLHPPGIGDTEKRRYATFYGVSRIRTLSSRRRGGPHPDLWRSLNVVFDGLGRSDGVPELGLPGLGSFLWSPAASPDLDAAQIANQYLLIAIRQLGFIEDREEKVLRPVDYRNLGTEELGAIYESLLEQHPDVNADAGTFRLNTAPGHERKTTGSYYTPSSLITELLDIALDPVISEAAATSNPEAAVLDLKVIDPACGSGHFLIAAAHRIAKRLAAIRTGEAEPSPDATRHALRDVIGRCLHGIDLNPMAVELCKVSLWMESMEPGKPLGFLDHRIVRGNALIGATPELLDGGIPDEAFKSTSGEDKAYVASLIRRNKQGRGGQHSLFGETGIILTPLAARAAQVDAISDDTVGAVQAKASRWNELVNSADYQMAVEVADLWCAAFILPKRPGSLVVTQSEFEQARTQTFGIDPETQAAVRRLALDTGFLHWHLAFMDAYANRDGFDAVLGNPPWLSYGGRQQAPLDPQVLNLLKVVYPSISTWPASHTAFLLVSLVHTRIGGRIGLVLPYQVSDLASYGPVRDAVARESSQVTVIDAGEDAFEGVSQRAGLFVLARARESEARPATSFSPRPSDRVDASANAELLGQLSRLPRVLPATFSDPGVHTGNVSKRVILERFDPTSPNVAPVREGRDINFYRCGPPRKGLQTNLEMSPDEYCRIQPLDRYQSVPILLRQTANRPIACRHTDRTYFRNSLLACAGIPGVPDAAVVGILNSRMIGIWYRSATRDSAQKAFPQVKVGLMRQMPIFTADTNNYSATVHTTLEALADAVTQFESHTDMTTMASQSLLDDIDRLVFRLYGVADSVAEESIQTTRSLE